VKTVLQYGDESISVGIEDVEPDDWAETVYKPDILDKRDTIFKQPGYNPLR
jgi:4-oxalocrotonate tautomerase